MSAPSKKLDAGDVAFTRSLLFYSNNARNMPSWLSNSLNVMNGTTSAENDAEEEIEDLGVEEEDGLGYIASSNMIPQDRQSMSANDKLRKQLLGNRSNKINPKGKYTSQKSDVLTASKPKPQSKKSNPRDVDDDEEGRTARTGSRSGGNRSLEMSKSTDSKLPGDGISSSKSSSKKRPASFLDEVLAKRQRKKNRSQAEQDSQSID